MGRDRYRTGNNHRATGSSGSGGSVFVNERPLGNGVYNWDACLDCGKERWVRYIHGEPNSKRCRQCGGRRRRGRNGYGEGNSNWRGGDAKATTGQDRARRMFPSPLPCSVCGGKSERHHKDGDTLNNESSNIAWLCRRHHMIADGRILRRNKCRVRNPMTGRYAKVGGVHNP